jgi:hypothetical protein
MNNKLMGYFTLIYNIALFVFACLFLYLIKRYPSYKVGLVVLVVGIILINLHSMLRWYWYKRTLKDLEKQQQANIVPDTCPDYWSKNPSSNGVECKNEFVTKGADDETNVTYYIGDKQKQFNINDTNTRKNLDKCSSWFTNDNYPWVEMHEKCLAGSYINKN